MKLIKYFQNIKQNMIKQEKNISQGIINQISNSNIMKEVTNNIIVDMDRMRVKKQEPFEMIMLSFTRNSYGEDKR